MIDKIINNTINFYYSLPQLLRHLSGSLKRNWKWLIAPLVTSIILLVVMLIGFKINKTTEETQAVWYYRYIGLISLIWTLVTLYFNIMRYRRDYYEYKNFDYPASFKTIIYTVIFSIGLLISITVVVFAKPVNLDSSFFAIAFYWLMWNIFIILVSQVLGLIRMVSRYKLFDIILYIMFAVMFLTVPIIFIPSEKPSIVMHILMLNPLFYLVSGIEEAVIIGINSLGNIPYHFFFLVWIGIAALLLYIFRPHIAYEKFRMTRNRSIHLKNTADPEKVKSTNITT
ncbi:hypothetical protein [Staphylococcus carnosus]|uniref:Uncharacterized protein n=1 Tax=Staphylococcus carnosus (strain TM300) TaxID=396513 RepID=B9DMV9_STACT|nr:hypothetical protein [Staphylococcus carnosus]QPT04458.1 hypothetical protein I6G40_03205 [Staphylococcus carnosus]UQA67183.1 hypothetical protein Sta3580_11860 [Staphylococcus carnosus]UTB77985.1 hypothetical protein A2I62_05115 [Staphylococcus carnosus]UTB87529.1 hypothetical protein A2I63_05105 [Staphylococcus carnosus]UTB89881.1 hypothetical protein A2I64_05110 [Staphylococcus carnosus]